MRRCTIVGIILIFILFLGFDYYRKSEKFVMKIIEPTIFQIDLNGNKVYDDGETICLPEITSFSADIAKNQDELSKNLNLSKKEILALGYMSEDFTDKILMNQKVKVKFTTNVTADCKFANVYINNESFSEKLIREGYALKDYIPLSKSKFQERLKSAAKLNLIILNHKSNKYHTIDCKYGLAAHDAIILLKQHLPQDSLACKFCHSHKESKAKIIETYPLLITSGNIKLFLTDFTLILKPDSNCSNLLCKEVVSLINNSNSTIDMALFGWVKVPSINKVLVNAMKRGVQVRLVYDETADGVKYYENTLQLAQIVNESRSDKSINKKDTNMLMHNKFIVFDNKKVITGSMNFSTTGLSGFNSNNMVVIDSKEIAEKFTNEFNQMMSGKFHQSKVPSAINSLRLSNANVSVYFSPQDKVISTHVIPLINHSKQYIYMPIFLITHFELSEALIKARTRGVDVRIITDATNPASASSQIKKLRSSDILIKTENYAGKMHSKTIIIDDKYLITGSMNFSKSGESKNDENVVIIEDSRLARHYKGYFDYIWKKIPDRYLKYNVRAESIYSIGSCSDGIDNNFDGKIDKDDVGCQKK